MADARRRFLKSGGRMIPERIDLFLAGIRSDKCRRLLDRWDANTVPASYAWLRTYAVNTKHVVDFVPADIATAPVQVGTLALGEDMPETLGFKASLTIDEDGTLDGIGGWFECELGGGVRMTNSPLARTAIRRHQIFLGFDAPMDVAAGDIVEVSVKLNHRNNVVAWNARDPRTGRMLRYSTWASMPMSRSERLKPSLAPRIVNF
ncbi:hypothetical protein [Novosphingobium sp.]|uniref:hypothetical protein n=1 Tax=Novosphingobium sp. TaxID=1874826 RepID=UPI002608A60A|nr:hypothetical protein [Novosphingobium sp.]